MALEVLVVDDERDIRELVAGILEDEGFRCSTASNSQEALARLGEVRPSLVILDVWLKNSALDGLELLQHIKADDPELPVIIVSGHGNIDMAVAAVAKGAVDFIEKPFQVEHLLHLVSKATETDSLRRENALLREQLGVAEEMTGNSASINHIRATLKRVAGTGSRLLISGPSGVGKEVAARMLHRWSERSKAAFVTFSSARLTEDRFEAELFGEEQDGKLVRPGLLEAANGGTLFLDEVADMPLATQAKILRILTEQSFSRVGGARQIRVDVRFISSTSRNLTEEIEKKSFREDLFYRLNVVPLNIPPLSERRDDIPVLVEYYLARYAADHRIPVPAISSEAMAALQSYDWPGNVRQLRNVVERTIILAPKSELTAIELDMLPPEIMQDDTDESGGLQSLMGSPLREARENFEREYLKIQIRRFSGNISRTANFIGMERSALHRKLKLLGLGER